uniref:Uncharacterized protein n=1 Tax=mine drainage metagenome TaxID=410659 RepID=E6QBF3_9ZZZZ
MSMDFQQAENLYKIYLDAVAEGVSGGTTPRMSKIGITIL